MRSCHSVETTSGENKFVFVSVIPPPRLPRDYCAPFVNRIDDGKVILTAIKCCIQSCVYCDVILPDYNIPFCRTNCRQLSLAYVGPKMWNTLILNSSLQHFATLHIFKTSQMSASREPVIYLVSALNVLLYYVTLL